MDELENFENIVQMTWKEYATKLLMENTEKQTHEDIVTNIINKCNIPILFCINDKCH